MHIIIPRLNLRLPSNEEATSESKSRVLQGGGQGKLQSSTVKHIKKKYHARKDNSNSSPSTPVINYAVSQSYA